MESRRSKHLTCYMNSVAVAVNKPHEVDVLVQNAMVGQYGGTISV
jgi:hypothetical protein